MKCLFGCIAILLIPACSSSPTRDAGENDAGATLDAKGNEAGTQCTFASGPTSDGTLTVAEPADYDGPVVVMSGDGGSARELVSPRAAIGTRIFIDGTLATIPVGSTLWAGVHQQEIIGNPFSHRVATAWTLRRSEQGPILAAGILDFVPSGSNPARFLGVPATVSPRCSYAAVNNIVTGVSCETISYFDVTLHGDSDVTLQPRSQGQVAIDGIAYDVWLEQSYTETITGDPCVSDWEPPLGFKIVGRAVRLLELLNGNQDGGSS